MYKFTMFFASRRGIILTGLFIGVIASILQKLGNPPNMGLAIACMERDIAGALGFHRNVYFQYIRPEIIGLVLGSIISALIFKEFKSRTGPAPMVKFVLGFFAMIGAMISTGCSWRALIRFAGGDGNAIMGLLGLIVGVYIGVLFIRSGYNLGANKNTFKLVGWIMPTIMIGLLILLLFKIQLQSDAPFFSIKGPGSQHAPIFISLFAGTTIGFFAQRTRFCTIGAIRDVIIMKNSLLLSGIIALVVGAFITNLLFNQFHAGFEGQPYSHTNHLWNFGGLMLAGLAFTLAGGCPARQLILSGEGDGDSALFAIGMILGGGFIHNFSIISSSAGVNQSGLTFFIAGLIICLTIGFTMRQKI